MTVKQLIAYLEKQPQHLPVIYRCYSEWAILTEEEIRIANLCAPRPDGWVHDSRPDKKTCEYLAFPGN